MVIIGRVAPKHLVVPNIQINSIGQVQVYIDSGCTPIGVGIIVAVHCTRLPTHGTVTIDSRGFGQLALLLAGSS
jgi:hypothetical protein